MRSKRRVQLCSDNKPNCPTQKNKKKIKLEKENEAKEIEQLWPSMESICSCETNRHKKNERLKKIAIILEEEHDIHAKSTLILTA